MADSRTQARRWGVFDYDEQQKNQEKAIQAYSNGGRSFYRGYINYPEGVKPFKFPENKPFIAIDIIPFLTDFFGQTQLVSELPYFRHNNIGSPYSHNYICPHRTFGKPCPICDAMVKYDFNDPDERAIRNTLRPKERRLYLVRWLDGPEESKSTLYVLDQSTFTFGDLISKKLMIRDREDPIESGWKKFPDLMEGFSLKIGLSTESFNNHSFAKPVSIDFKPRSYQYASTPEEEEAFLSTIPDLYKCLNVLSYDELNEKFQSGMRTNSPDLNSSPTQPEVSQRLDPTMGYSPLVKDVSVFTAQRNIDVEDDTPF